MSNSGSNTKFYYYLAGLTLAGLLLRINHTWSESITADEVSALLRLQFDSLGEMIRKGVRPDGHPAFTQVLLWFWIKLFGNSEFAVRLPFVLMGTASIWFAGSASRRWFGPGTGLAVAAAMAFLQFPIMYSQLARPHAPGLFFTMWAVCSLSRFTDGEVKWRHVLAFAIACAGAAYSHYFSLLTALLIAVAGLFLVSKTNVTKYLVACLAALLLFIPHISITLAQLEIGGVGGPGGWLAAPTTDFFWGHVMVMLDSSQGMAYVVLFVALLSLVLNNRPWEKKQIAALLIWLVPMITGYLYSVYKNPVLQHSVLLFSFPFFLMFIFSWFPNDEESKWPYRFSNALIILFAGYITLYKPFRLTDHFGRLHEIVDVYYAAKDRYGAEKVNAAFNVDDPYFVNYYGRTVDGQPSNLYCLKHDDAKTELAQLRYAVSHASGDYFVYGWSTRESSPASLDIIAESYPCLVEKHEWFNSAVYVFAKNKVYPEDCPYHSTILFYSYMNIHPNDTIPGRWSPACGQTGDQFTLDSACQFGPVIKVAVGDVLKNPDNEIILHASMFPEEPGTNAVLVVEFMRNGQTLMWTGTQTNTQLNMNDMGWQTAYYGLRPPLKLQRSDTIKAYVYTPDLKTIHVRNLAFMTRLGHRGIYGPRPDIE